MTGIKDVEVKIDVLHPNAVVGLGVPLIVAKGTAVSYKEYKSLETLVVDYGKETTVYKAAETEFKQKNKAAYVAVATYVGTTPTAGESLLEVFEKYYGKTWHFAIFPDATPTEILPASQLVEEKEFKFIVLQSSTKADFTPFVKLARTLKYFHAKADTEFLNAAIIGDVANLPVGQSTWKFRKNLFGITPNDDLTGAEVDALHEMGVNTYLTKVGVPQTSEGLAAPGEFIDFYHGQDFVKSDAETRLQKLLVENDKIPANDEGVSMIGSTFTSTLEVAGQQGIIEKGDSGYLYTIETDKFEDGAEEDRLKRVYAGVRFSYSPQGAIHKIRVNGSVITTD